MEFLERGNQHCQNGRYSDAMINYGKAIQRMPEQPDTYLQRAYLYQQLNRYIEAVFDFTKVIELDPNSATAYYGRGNSYFNLKNYQAAFNDYEEAIRLNPEHSNSYFGKGNVLYEWNLYNQSIVDYTKAIELNPRDPTNYINRGNAKKQLEDNQGANQDYDRAMKMDAKDTNGYFNRGILNKNQQNYQEAINDFTEVIRLERDHVQGYKQRGLVQHLMGRNDEAVKDYTQALKYKESDPSIYDNRGVAQMQMENYENAGYDFQKAIKWSPKYALSHFHLANCQQILGDKQKAQETNQQGKDSLESEQFQDIKERYNISDETISFYRQLLQRFDELRRQLMQLQEVAKYQNKHLIIQRTDELKSEGKQLQIKYFSDNQKNHYDRYSGEYQELKAKVRELIRNNQRSQKAMTRTESVKQTQYKQKTDYQRVSEHIDNIDQKVFQDGRIRQKIQSISNPKLSQYYSLLKSFMLNHLIGYRVCYAGFYSQHNRQFTDSGRVFDSLSRPQPISNKIHIYSQLIQTPFELLERYLKQETHHLNKNISYKIGQSNFTTDAIISSYVSYTIETLIENNDFNSMIIQAIQDEQDSYLSRIAEKVFGVKDMLSSRLYGNNQYKYSYISQVVGLHMTMVTNKLYEVDSEEFGDISGEGESFYQFVFEAIVIEEEKREQNNKNSKHQVNDPQLQKILSEPENDPEPQPQEQTKINGRPQPEPQPTQEAEAEPRKEAEPQPRKEAEVEPRQETKVEQRQQAKDKAEPNTQARAQPQPQVNQNQRPKKKKGGCGCFKADQNDDGCQLI